MQSIAPFIISILISVLWSSQCYSQSIPSSNKKTPKIGLVLSGGGALGLAHIGVLKVLEEKGIKPDFIVGTSMGSVVGGLYAIGYSASEIETITRNTNWDEILSRSIPLNYVANEEKYDYGRYTLNFPFKNGKPKLPSGLVQGQLLTDNLVKLTWPAINYSNFDEFPIPFRCIGTDLSTGKQIIFKDGSLALSMRASMAIPTIFTPVNIDSTLVVDGGIINNFPVDVAKELGADYIIGIDVTSGYQKAHDIDNILDILYQISIYPSLEKMEKHIQLSDLYIHPNVSHFSASDFNNSKNIIASGEEMARIKIPEIDSFLNKINYQPHPINKHVIATSDSIKISNVNIQTITKTRAYTPTEKLKRKENSIIDIKSYKKDVRLLYGSLKYKSINYWPTKDSIQVSDSTSNYHLNVKLEESSNSSFKVGIHYDNVFGFGVITNLTTYNLLGKNSRLRLIIDLNESFKSEIEWMKNLGKKQNYSLLVDYKFYSLKQPTYNKGQLSGFQQNDISYLEAKIQTNKKLNNVFSTGFLYLFDAKTIKIGETNFQNFHSRNNYHILFLQYKKNTLNRNYHSTKGHSLFLRYDIVLNDYLNIKYPNNTNAITLVTASDTNTYTQKEFNSLLSNKYTPQYVYENFILKYHQNIRLTKKLNLVTHIDAVITLNQKKQNQLYRGFNIGGNINLFYSDFQLYGLQYAENFSPNISLLKVDLQYSILNKFIIYGGINNAWLYNSGFRISDFSNNTKTFSANKLLGYGISAAYLSPLGPIEISTSWNSIDPYTRVNIMLGFQF